MLVVWLKRKRKLKLKNISQLKSHCLKNSINSIVCLHLIFIGVYTFCIAMTQQMTFDVHCAFAASTDNGNNGNTLGQASDKTNDSTGLISELWLIVILCNVIYMSSVLEASWICLRRPKSKDASTLYSVIVIIIVTSLRVLFILSIPVAVLHINSISVRTAFLCRLLYHVQLVPVWVLFWTNSVTYLYSIFLYIVWCINTLYTTLPVILYYSYFTIIFTNTKYTVNYCDCTCDREPWTIHTRTIFTRTNDYWLVLYWPVLVLVKSLSQVAFNMIVASALSYTRNTKSTMLGSDQRSGSDRWSEPNPNPSRSEPIIHTKQCNAMWESNYSI